VFWCLLWCVFWVFRLYTAPLFCNLWMTSLCSSCARTRFFNKILLFKEKKKREMIFEHPFCDNFCYNFLSHTHIIFYFISIALIFVQYLFFSLQIMVVPVSCQLKVVQITLLKKKKNMDTSPSKLLNCQTCFRYHLIRASRVQ